MSTVNPTDDLAALDHAVAVGVVPGEHRAWCSEVDAAIARLGAALPMWRDALAQAVEQGADGRADILPHVLRVRAEGDRLMRKLQQLHRRVDRLLEHDARSSGSEEDLCSQGKLRRDLAAWGAHWRLLEGDVETRNSESVHRDEGTGD